MHCECQLNPLGNKINLFLAVRLVIRQPDMEYHYLDCVISQRSLDHANHH